jgi:TPR repeat protein
LSGPSFLGLSGPANTSEDYSYLMDEQEHSSHVGSYVFLVLLLILGAAVYLNWQPIHTWVVNTALSHMKTAAPAQPAPAQPSAAQTDNESNRTVTTETGSAQPAIEEKPAENSPKDLPQQDKATSAAKAGQAGESKDTTSEPAGAASPQKQVSLPPASQAKASNVKPDDDSADDSSAAKPASRAQRRTAAVRDRRNAEQGSQGDDLVSTGERYLYGRGVMRNCGQAVTYFRAAAGKQNSRAFSHLGALYATGECVPQDRALAYSWFSRALAMDRSNAYLERNLTMLWRDMSATERQRAMQGRTF